MTGAEPQVAAASTYNLADQWEAVADRVGDREAVVAGDRRLTYAQLEERANRLAHHLASVGVGPGDFVGCYLTNGTEYLETMLAAFKLRAVPVNINYRYVADELRYLFADAGLVAVVCEQRFAANVAEVAADVPTLRHTLVVAEPGTTASLDGVPGGVDYEAALAASAPERPEVDGRGDDDIYVIYTGGTTGMPKGVVWRMGDAFFGCIGGGDPMRMTGPVSSPEETVERIIDFDFTFYALAPMMHAAAQWVSIMWLLCGAKVVLHQGRFDPAVVWRTVAAEKVSAMTVVGDAMARPLCDEWDANGPFDASSLFSFSNGGAPISATARHRVQEMLPNVVFTDGFGSSETGIQGSQRLQPGEEAGNVTRYDNVADGTKVLDLDGNELVPGTDEIGRVAHTGWIPLRYHNAPEKTAEAFVEIDGRRYVVSGDMARVEADGSVVLLGRGSVSINTGGEKVFPEEVEGVLKGHPDVYDAVVVGVPHERWGEQVVAVVQPVGGRTPTLDDIEAYARDHLAGYKLPRELVLVDTVVRSPAGKADYRWAKQVAAAPA
ncbi:acyl-CoA synthetase [Dermatobacter hominis]|uniref:acyl-CoA synthetase n=1 Tax=Dermatobacter hominis TaxID=2884263 RepID=UPI001D108FD2|nr:acyl-CoA synthetase [Dermatobacter hominis]UDY37797.1 acyl-CoA synthetase [Dermatobacter hominis]